MAAAASAREMKDKCDTPNKIAYTTMKNRRPYESLAFKRNLSNLTRRAAFNAPVVLKIFSGPQCICHYPRTPDHEKVWIQTIYRNAMPD
ncbi:hypothetical protein Q4525_12870 [Shimia thalassica]|uniref:hypothetical protein n=1 Tax=Shimia thalassica TaxID=1715693 RepID=UPI001C0937E7|nr:hypothetical protein [Shimia thalassica]MBU2941790.1 hypothetical protein [Shimia thalassica]MDO6503830.1 hypothetical protein [Shimia thalassica]